VARVVCVLFKLKQGTSLLIVLEFFAIGKSTASGMIRDFVKSVNIEMRNKIAWPIGNQLCSEMEDFCAFSNLFAVVKAIDGIHFDIRSLNVSPEDYFYFKSGGYII
jgi:hypothetical protein